MPYYLLTVLALFRGVLSLLSKKSDNFPSLHSASIILKKYLNDTRTTVEVCLLSLFERVLLASPLSLAISHHRFWS